MPVGDRLDLRPMSLADAPAPGPPRKVASRFLPTTIGGFCLWAMLIGTGAAWAFGRRCAVLSPVGEIFLRASQIAVMPYLLVELVGAIGRLDREGVGRIARYGGIGWLAGLGLGVAVVVALPAMLPELTSSGFFSPQVFEPDHAPGLIETYLPFNIFGALAEDNFPASILFAAILGVALQAAPRRELLLDPLDQLRLVLRRLNGWAALLAPAGIFALTAVTLGSLSREVLLRSQALIALEAAALVLVALAVAGLVVACSPLDVRDLWSAVRGPLVICLTTANLMIALPLLQAGLREVLARRLGSERGPGGGRDGGPAEAAPGDDAIDALVPVGFALPNLGQVVSLVFVPFAAWLVDRPMEPPGILSMLATGIPTATGGIRVAIGRELVKAGLPLDLLGLVDVNGNWIYRVEKTLSLLGIALVVAFAVCGVAGRLRARAGRLAATAALVGVLALGLVAGGRATLARSLEGTYANDRTLLALRSAVEGPEPTEVLPRDTRAEPVDFASIRRRGVLRVGVREGAIPWSHRGSEGRIVGYDVDVAKALAADLGLSLEVVPASLPELERLLADGHVDLAVGGIQPTTDRGPRLQASRAYQPVHMALVVRDEMVRDVQQLATRPLGRLLLIGIPAGDPTSAELEKRVELALGGKGSAVPVGFVALDRAEDFFAPAAGNEEMPDALLETAEGGAARAVVHPETTMVTVFGADIPSEFVFLAGGSDRSTVDVVDRWIERRDRKGLFRKLFRHWVEVRGDDAP